MTDVAPAAPPDAAPPGQRFDLLLEGATLITGDVQQPLLRDASLGVLDGRIAWIGTQLPAGAQVGRHQGGRRASTCKRAPAALARKVRSC